jgi:hypothetical protein
MEVNAVGFCRSRSQLKLEFQNTFLHRFFSGELLAQGDLLFRRATRFFRWGIGKT